MKQQIGKLFKYGAAYGVGYGMGCGLITYNNVNQAIQNNGKTIELLNDYHDKRLLENEGNVEGLKQWGTYMDDKWGSGKY